MSDDFDVVGGSSSALSFASVWKSHDVGTSAGGATDFWESRKIVDEVADADKFSAETDDKLQANVHTWNHGEITKRLTDAAKWVFGGKLKFYCSS